MKRMRSLTALLLTAALLLTGVSVAGAAEGGKKYTVMYYICGADLERDHGQATKGMADVLSSRYNTDEVNAIALLGGTPKWSGNQFDPGILSIVNLSGRRPSKVDQMPLSAMSEPETLTGFLRYCRENYPAEHYILVICDHGGGPLMGCCVDYLFDRSMMSVGKLSKALADSPFAERGLDTIVFDCCLMGSLEIANCLAPYAKYMVATEDAMYSLYHDWMNGLENDATELDTAKRIADSTYRKNHDQIELQKATQLNSVSVTDLQKIGTAVENLNQFFAAMPEINETSFSAVSGRRRDMVTFGVVESGGNSQYDLVDVGSLVEGMDGDPAAKEALQAALAEAVPHHLADVEGCTGLTIYFPYLNKRSAAGSMATYAGLGFASAYVDYVGRYAAIMTGTPLAAWQGVQTGKPEAQKDMQTRLTAALNEEQAEQYAGALMKVLWKTGEDTYAFASVDSAVSFNAERRQITGNYNSRALFLEDENGERISAALPFSVAQNGTLLVPAELTLASEDGEEPAVHQAMIYCEMDETSRELTPGGVAVWDETMQGWTTSMQTVLSDYQRMTLRQVTRKETRDENGALLPFDDWEEAGEQRWTAEIGGSWKLKMEDVRDEEEFLFGAFELQDTQGDRHTSELYGIKPIPPKPDEMIVKCDNLDMIELDSFDLNWQNQMILTAGVTNRTDTEMVVQLENLTLNGEAVEASQKAYGNGPNWGLIRDENQILTVFLPAEKLEGIDTLTSLTCDLTLLDAANEENVLGVAKVEVTMNWELPKDDGEP